MTLYSHLESHTHDISSLRLVVVAGSALPRQFVEMYGKKYGIRFMLAWGMTELTPIGVGNVSEEPSCIPAGANNASI